MSEPSAQPLPPASTAMDVSHPHPSPQPFPTPPSPLSRILIAIARAALFIALVIPLTLMFGFALIGLGWQDQPLLLSVFSVFPAAIAANFICLRLERRQSLSEVGAGAGASAAISMSIGTALGAGLCLAILATQAAMGWIVWEPAAGGEVWQPGLAPGLFILLAGAAGEELAFRGYAQQQLMRAIGVWPALIGTSLIFGLMHAGNPDASRIAVANTALFGLLFGFALVRHRTLWLPFGMHWGWNLTLAVLGVNVSGIRIKLTAWDLAARGPELWTGGDYGPEASALTTIAVALAGICVAFIPTRETAGKRVWEWRAELSETRGDG